MEAYAFRGLIDVLGSGVDPRAKVVRHQEEARIDLPGAIAQSHDRTQLSTSIQFHSFARCVAL